MNTHLAPLLSFLGHAMFWRRRASAADAESAATEDAPALLPESATDTEASTASKPGLAARVLGRLALWRRKGEASEAAEAEADAQQTLPASVSTDEASEAPPRRPLGKRILLVLIKKTVWVPAAAVLLVALGALSSVLFMRAQQAEQDKALRALQAAKLKLERENRTLRAQPATTAATVATSPSATPAAPHKDDPAFDIAVQPGRDSAGAADESGDCIVSDKEKVGESLRRCIETFNRATSVATKKR